MFFNFLGIYMTRIKGLNIISNIGLLALFVGSLLGSLLMYLTDLSFFHPLVFSLMLVGGTLSGIGRNAKLYSIALSGVASYQDKIIFQAKTVKKTLTFGKTLSLTLTDAFGIALVILILYGIKLQAKGLPGYFFVVDVLIVLAFTFASNRFSNFLKTECLPEIVSQSNIRLNPDKMPGV
jgi:hypothetical protein